MIFNLAQMGIAIRDADLIEVDTYLELVDLFAGQRGGIQERGATQSDMDAFLT